MRNRKKKHTSSKQKRSSGPPKRRRRTLRPDPEPEVMRLNRYIARSGVCSRRQADDLIAKGLVKVNGKVVTEMGTKVQPGDVVEANGKTISPAKHVYILLNKPGDVITTTDDERGRKTVLDFVQIDESEAKGIFPVGRLDRHTTGVLVITNDGELANRLMHPRYETEKLYLVTTKESVKPHQLAQLREGIELEDGSAAADNVSYVHPDLKNQIGIAIHEGRNRQIRRMMTALGHEITSLERVRYAGLTTSGVRRGKWRHLLPHEVRKLKKHVKL